MLSMTIILEGDGALPELAGRLENGELTHALALTAGMMSGKPFVAIVVQTADGRAVLGQTSLALFLSAADAFKARHGDPRQDDQAKGVA